MYELRGYSPEVLDQIRGLLERASKGREIDPDALEDDLLAVVHAVGLAHNGSEVGRFWLELEANDPSHAAMAAGFARAAEAKNPLDATVLEYDLRPELNGIIRNRWKAHWDRQHRNREPSLSSVDWNFLNQTEREEIRQMLRHLEAYHRSFARRGRIRKNKLDTALRELALVFIEYTGLAIAKHRMKYSINSRFIKFCVLALAPVGRYFEVSPQALSRRWERQIMAMRRALPDEDVKEG